MRTRSVVCAFLVLAPALLGQGIDPARLSIRLTPNHTPELTIAGTPGASYAVQRTASLPPSKSWDTLTNFTLVSTQAVWLDPAGSLAASSYYRAVISVVVPTNIVNPHPGLLIWITPGTFLMGSPETEIQRGDDETQHSVTLTRGFYMSKHLVTQASYLDVTGQSPSHFTGGTDLPVESISWHDATNYCGILTRRERGLGLIPATWGYRLPTESEWEYSARAGTTTPLFLGNRLTTGMANFFVVSGYDSVVGELYDPRTPGYVGQTTPVGRYAPNPWGLYDMAGNLWELCLDWYGDYPPGGALDPRGPSVGEDRVMRGGSWASYGENCRSAVRFYFNPAARSPYVGFRPVLAPSID